MAEPISTFQARLIQALNEKGITQAELGRKSNISRAIISDYIHGKYEAKQDKVYAIAKALDVSEAWLMGFDANKTRKEFKEEGPTTPSDVTQEDIEHYLNGLRSYNGLEITEEQKAYLRNDIKNYLESTKSTMKPLSKDMNDEQNK